MPQPGRPKLGSTVPGSLTIEELREDERHTLALSGELDLASAAALEALVVGVCTSGAREIVFDLSRLSFIDSSGLRVILSSMQLCEQHQCAFWLVPGQAQVQRLFEVAGVIQRLPFRQPDSVQATP
jgi:anti-sigma B factor antagonist